jgi:hypothetical protein
MGGEKKIKKGGSRKNKKIQIRKSFFGTFPKFD